MDFSLSQEQEMFRNYVRKYLDDAGQTKTVVVERALAAYFNDYDRTQRQLRCSVPFGYCSKGGSRVLHYRK